MNWSIEQILALAPDAASAKAGQGLAAARKWSALGCDEAAAWGLCQGSGKDPYQTQVELGEPAFRCSCPSRKFPCKHGLGLLLLLAAQPQAFKQKKPPAWVSEWLATRAQRSQQREEKRARAEEKAADPAAQAKRAASREAKVASGLQELELWLRDLIRQGLATAQTQPASFWQRPAARLIDAQAPGLARLVNELAGVPVSGADWQARLLERLSLCQLLLEGYKHHETLPPEVQADLRTLIGWTVNQEELLKEPGVRDRWLVLGQCVENDDRLRVQRIWLQGQASGRAALLLHFAHGQQPLETGFSTGTLVEAELVFFPGNYPLRALAKERYSAPAPAPPLVGAENFEQALGRYVEALTRQPWLEQFPLCVTAAIPLRRGEQWFLRDANERLLPLSARFTQAWELAAVSGGHPLAVFGEWDGRWLWPLTAWVEARWLHFER